MTAKLSELLTKRRNLEGIERGILNALAYIRVEQGEVEQEIKQAERAANPLAHITTGNLRYYAAGSDPDDVTNGNGHG